MTPAMVMGPPVPGRRAVVLGDTWDSRHLLGPGRGADVLVHEATYSRGEPQLFFPR